MAIPPVIISPVHMPVRRKPQLPVPRREDDDERQMTVFSIDEAGNPLIPRDDVTAAPGHHPYLGMPGVKGMVKPGILLDIVV